MQLLFSYGTLQHESVQLSTFSRRLVGVADRLPGYRLTQVPISDPRLAEIHGASHYANVVPTTRLADEVSGTLLEITDEELGRVDGYERLDGYSRIQVNTASGRPAWVYVSDSSL